MIEAVLAVKIPNLWHCEVTEKHDVRLKFLSCMPFESGGRAIVEILGREKILDYILEELAEKSPKVSLILSEKEKRRLVFKGTMEDCKACKYLVMSGCFLVTPFFAEKGYMNWILVTDEKDSLNFLFEKLKELGCDVKVLKITGLEEEGILSKRQEEILKHAVGKGYFEFPKKIGIRDLAEEFDVSIATISEILRNAEQKILRRHFELT
ncbi:MAG: helix-turn-helix domain-containing protein [Candidatus Methanofastidiosia archaeon]